MWKTQLYVYSHLLRGMVGINHMILDYLTRADMKPAQLARLCNTSQQNMSKKLAQNDMELSWVIRISVALNHNFLYDVAKEIKVKFDQGVKSDISLDEILEKKIESILSNRVPPKQQRHRSIGNM
jgi:hypothetical protein